MRDERGDKRGSTNGKDRLDVFIEKLEEELTWRHDTCNDAAATPSSILLAVLNAVAEAKKWV